MKNISRRETIKWLGTAGLASLFSFRMLGESTAKMCDICKGAWLKLSTFTATRYQFRYIEPVAKLPKVFIYGDSISIGYTEYVRQSLTDKACVYRLHRNGGSSNDFIEYMEQFRKGMFQPELKEGWDFEWDIIHFNVGLHDLKYLHNRNLDKVNGEQVSSLEDYANNLKEIVEYLKSAYPNAKLVFATTTPVPEGEPGRLVGDAKRYNKVARKVLKKYKDVKVNDLYQFSLPVIEQYAQSPGNVHYLPEGSRLQGIEVANVLASELGIEAVECPSSQTIVEEMKAYGKAIGHKQKVIIH
jgi:hypothetical protein